MVLNAGDLNRRLQIQRFVETGRDRLNGPLGDWQSYGAAVFARRRDVSDGERVSAGRWGNQLVTRFVVRATAFSRSITRRDRLVHEGITFSIDGIKEVPGERGFIEITAQTGEA